MEYVILISILTIFYVLPAITAWRLTRRAYQEVWDGLKPGAEDLILVFFPIGNIVTCLEIAKRLSQKKNEKTIYDRFFRL